MFHFSVFTVEADAIPASACSMPSNFESLCRYQKAPKTFIIHSKAEWSENPQNKAKYYLFSFLFILFVCWWYDIYIFIHLWLASTTHKGQQVQPNHFFSSAKKKKKENEATRTILSITQRYLSFRCLVWVPQQPKQQSMGLMNLFCGGHGIHTLRTVVIWATTDSAPSTPQGVGVAVLLAKLYTFIHPIVLYLRYALSPYIWQWYLYTKSWTKIDTSR